MRTPYELRDNMTRRLLLISTSTLHGSGYLEYCADEISSFLADRDRLLFVPFARPSGITHDEYTKKACGYFAKLNVRLRGLHEFDDPVGAVRDAAAIFIGGGNTFVLLRQLHAARVMDAIRKRVDAGIPYMGTSAGVNVAGPSIGTTNDMPIVYPPSLAALGLVPFNINPHYLDPDPNSKHMGETRETRIREFHVFNSQPVIGLREGTWLRVTGDVVELQGTTAARLFRAGLPPIECEPGARLESLVI